MKTKQTCDYSGCDEQIRDEDLLFSPTAKKYCARHGKEIDDALNGGDPAKIMRWWVKSMQAGHERTFTDCPECGNEMMQNTIGEWQCLSCEAVRE